MVNSIFLYASKFLNQSLWNVDKTTLQLCFLANSTAYGAHAKVSPIDLDSKEIKTFSFSKFNVFTILPLTLIIHGI